MKPPQPKLGRGKTIQRSMYKAKTQAVPPTGAPVSRRRADQHCSGVQEKGVTFNSTDQRKLSKKVAFQRGTEGWMGRFHKEEGEVQNVLLGD